MRTDDFLCKEIIQYISFIQSFDFFFQNTNYEEKNIFATEI